MPKANYVSILLYRIFNCLFRLHNRSSRHRNSPNHVDLLRAPRGYPAASILRCRVVVIRITFLELWPATVLSNLENIWAGRGDSNSNTCTLLYPREIQQQLRSSHNIPRKRYRDIYVGRNQYPRKFSFPNFSHSL